MEECAAHSRFLSPSETHDNSVFIPRSLKGLREKQIVNHGPVINELGDSVANISSLAEVTQLLQQQQSLSTSEFIIFQPLDLTLPTVSTFTLKMFCCSELELVMLPSFVTQTYYVVMERALVWWFC